MPQVDGADDEEPSYLSASVAAWSKQAALLGAAASITLNDQLEDLSASIMGAVGGLGNRIQQAVTRHTEYTTPKFAPTPWEDLGVPQSDAVDGSQSRRLEEHREDEDWVDAGNEGYEWFN